MADYGTYASLSLYKTRHGIADTVDDVDILRHLEGASRVVDRHCRRHFYVKTETRYLDASNAARLWLDNDLLAVTSLLVDEDGDADYENTWKSTDYILWPYTAFPKLAIDADVRQGDYTGFYGVQKSVQIAGQWGYGDGESATPCIPSGATCTTDSTTNTVVTMSDQSKLQIGQNILVDTEQMYVTALTEGGSSDTATVVRGVNGTTAATHTAKPVYVYRYPDDVRDATLMIASRMWKRKDSLYATVVGNPSLGTMDVHQGMDNDVIKLLAPYIWLSTRR